MFSGNARKIATVLTAKDEASGDIREVEKAGDDAAESLEDTEEATIGLSQAFAASAAVTTALAGSLALLVRQHGRTEQRFARLQAVTGATDEQMSQLRSTVASLGRELPITIGDAADAMENLAFAGFEASEAMAAAEGVANLAVAANMSMSKSARAVGSALNAFNLEARQTGQVTGTMAAVVAASNTRFQELNSAIERVSGSARMLGVSFQETAAALGVMANQGIRASGAGTALNAMFTRLASRSGQAQEALDEIGVELEDLTNESGELLSLDEVLLRLAEGMENVEGRAEQMRIAAELAGRRGARAILPLLNSQEELNKKMGEIFRSEIRESIGMLSRLSPEQAEGVEEALGMDIEAGDVTPREIIERMEELNAQGESTEEIASRMQAALGISRQAAEAFAQDIDDANTSTEELAVGLGNAKTASEIATSQMNTAAGAVKFMKSSFDAMTFAISIGASPAIERFNMALGRGINLLNQNKAATMAVGSALAVLTGALGILTIALGAAVARSALLSAAQGTLAAQFLKTASSEGILAAVTWAAGGAAGFAAGMFWSLAGAVLALSWPVLAIIGIFLALIAIWKFDLLGAGEEAGAILGFLGDVLGWVTGKVWGLLETLWPLIKILGLLNMVAAFGPLVLILKTLGLLWDVTVAIISPIGDFISKIGKLKAALLVLAAPVLQLIAGFKALQWVIGLVGDAMDGFDIGSFLGDIWEDIKSAIPSGSDAVAWGREIISGLGKGIKNKAASMMPGVMGGLGNLIKSFIPGSDAERGPLSNWTQAGPNVINTLTSGMQQVKGSVAGTMEGIAQTIGGTALDAVPGGGLIGGAMDTLGLGGGGDGSKKPKQGNAAKRKQSQQPIEVNQEFVFEGDVDPEEVGDAAEEGTLEALSLLEKKLLIEMGET